MDREMNVPIWWTIPDEAMRSLCERCLHVVKTHLHADVNPKAVDNFIASARGISVKLEFDYEEMANDVTEAICRDLIRLNKFTGLTAITVSTPSDEVITKLGKYVFSAMQNWLYDEIRRKAGQHRRVGHEGDPTLPVDAQLKTPLDETLDEVSTEEAAKLLGVSRPHVAKLVDTGKLSARMVGWFRRLNKREVLAYKEHAQHAARKAARKVVRLVEAEETDGQELEAGEGPTVIHKQGV